MTENTQAPSRRYAWFVLVMMVLLYLVNVADRYVASGLLEEIKKTFEVSDTFMGFLVGPAFAIVYTLLAIPIARFADRHNRVRIICAGAIIWSGFTVASGLAQTPWTFAMARLGVGVGEAAFLAPAFSLLSDYFPPKKRALAFAILNFGVYFGQIFGLVGGAAIADASSWRTAFIALGAPGVLLALMTLVLVREPQRGRLDGQIQDIDAARLSFGETVSALFAQRSFRFMTLGTALGGFASYGFGIWAPTLFARAFDLSLTEANARYGGPSFLAGITGAIVLGILCDRLSSKDARWPFRLSAIGLVGFFVTMFILCFVNDILIATLLTFPAGLMAGGWVIAQQSALQDLLPAKARATGTAIWAFALTFTGLALGVWFAGAATDWLSPQYGDQSIRYAMAATLLFTIPAVIFLLMAGKSVAADREALLQRLG
ncbi:MAG: MFS transporter [Hyphomonadaceae bacterium]|nr:MFS transporter [Hyphomonadaceae bacterium]